MNDNNATETMTNRLVESIKKRAALNIIPFKDAYFFLGSDDLSNPQSAYAYLCHCSDVTLHELAITACELFNCLNTLMDVCDWKLYLTKLQLRYQYIQKLMNNPNGQYDATVSRMADIIETTDMLYTHFPQCAEIINVRMPLLFGISPKDWVAFGAQRITEGITDAFQSLCYSIDEKENFEIRMKLLECMMTANPNKIFKTQERPIA